jgi:hypothetical protein
MKKIVGYLKAHLRETGGWAIFGWLLLLLGAGMAWRYAGRNDPYFHDSPYRHALGLGFYALPYLGTALVAAWAGGKLEAFRQRGFWVLGIFLLAVPFANQFMLYYKDWIAGQPPALHYFLRKTLFNLHTASVYLLVPLAYWKWIDRDRPGSFYGFTAKGFQARPYWAMLAVMLPLLAWASFRPDFLAAYPRYRAGAAEMFWGVSPWLTVGAYELGYALQFVFLEFFFRGFMVMALARYLGAYAVYPMVAVYCFIHFGKPMPEALGSIFGGYILGVVALRSGSVLGGVLIHIGVALGMELFAYWQLYLR